MPHRILALDIGEHALRAAAVESSFRDYRVTGLYEQHTDGEGSLAERVRAFLAAHNLTADTVLVTIPGELATQRTLVLPFRDRKRLEQTIPFELETLVPFGLDEVVVDYQVLRRDRSGATVLAALVQKADLERHLSSLAEAGLDPKVVDFGPLCSLNTVSSLVREVPDTYAYVEVTPSDVSVAFYRDKQLVGVRALTLAPAVSGNRPAPPTPTPAEGLAEELRWTLLVLNDGPYASDLPCVLAGEPGEFLTEVTQAFSERTGVRVVRLESLPLRPLAGLKNGDATAFARPLGLALREVAPANALGLNFRRGEFTYHQGQIEMRRALMRSGVLGAIVVALMLTNLYVSFRLEEARVAAIDAQVRQIFTSTMGDQPMLGNPVTQLQTEIDTAQKKLGFLADAAPVGNLTAIDVLYALAAAVPAQLSVEVDEYTMDTDSIRIRGRTNTFESVDEIKKRLGSVSYFREVQVKDVKAKSDGTGIEFRVNLLLNKPGQEAQT